MIRGDAFLGNYRAEQCVLVNIGSAHRYRFRLMEMTAILPFRGLFSTACSRTSDSFVITRNEVTWQSPNY